MRLGWDFGFPGEDPARPRLKNSEPEKTNLSILAIGRSKIRTRGNK